VWRAKIIEHEMMLASAFLSRRYNNSEGGGIYSLLARRKPPACLYLHTKEMDFSFYECPRNEK
jgi:hypothetical protein